MLLPVDDHDLAAFEKFDDRRAADSDGGATGAGASQVHGAFEFARIDQVNDVRPGDVEDSRKEMDRKAVAGWQILGDMHGLNA